MKHAVRVCNGYHSSVRHADTKPKNSESEGVPVELHNGSKTYEMVQDTAVAINSLLSAKRFTRYLIPVQGTEAHHNNKQNEVEIRACAGTLPLEFSATVAVRCSNFMRVQPF